MNRVKFYGMIPVTVYHDNHEVHQYEDFLKIMCPQKDELYKVSSNKGSIDMFCPGCGVEMKKEGG